MRKRGFTLIELMIAVCIIGVLASVAMPTYQRFVNEARGAEAVESLGALYRGAVAYWEKPVTGKGLAATGAGHCIIWPDVPSGILPPLPAVPYKRTADFINDAIFGPLGFTRPDPSYFVMVAVPAIDEGGSLRGPCNPTDGLGYAFFAACDINGDGLMGGFSLLANVRNGELVRAYGLGNVGAYFEYMGMACPICAPGIN